MSFTDWEARYQTGDMPWEKGAPSPGLVDFLAAHRDLAGKTVCVPGCGTGHDVREWARAGFEVYGYGPRAECDPVEPGADASCGIGRGVPAWRFFTGRTAIFIRLDF